MKVILMSALAFILIGLCGCTDASGTGSNGREMDDGWVNFGCSHWTKVIYIKEHEYIVLYGMKSSGIIHSGSCQCNSKTKKGEINECNK